MRTHPILILAAVAALAFSCRGEKMPQTPRTRGLIKELLTKLDSTDAYAAQKDRAIQSVKDKLPGSTGTQRYKLCYKIADDYSTYVLDSALFYFGEAIQIAREIGCDSLRIEAEFREANLLTVGGWYVEAEEILSSIPRKSLSGSLLEAYYNAWTLRYHELYSVTNGPA